MRFVKRLLLLAGAILLAVLVHRVGAEPVLATLRALAWWQFIVICLPYSVIAAVDTLGWRFAFARGGAPFWRLYGARLAGEALNVVTAAGSVGGEAVKAWLVRRDVSYAESVPSIVVAKTTIVISQVIYLLLGIVLAWGALDVSGPMLRSMLWLLLIEVLAVGGFFAAQAIGLVGHGGRALVWAGLTADATAAESLDVSLRNYYRHEWRRFAVSTAFHMLAWLLGALEATLMLWLLGVTGSTVTATVIEALGSGRAVRVVHGAGQPRRHRGGLRRHLRRARLRRRRRARLRLGAARAPGGVDRGGPRGAAGDALGRGARARAGYAVRLLKYESLTAILPCSNVNTSQPLTSIFLPSAVVPVKTHSERPRSPATKWRASPKWASGKILKTFAKASRTRSRPS